MITRRAPALVQPATSTPRSRAPAKRGANPDAAAGNGHSRSSPLSMVGNQAVQRIARETGQPLPTMVRAPLEAFTGANLAGARVHTGSGAEELTSRHDARALTYGENIYLGAGESARDAKLLAHEAAHVVQQTSTPSAVRSAGSGAPSPYLVPTEDLSEREADAMADAIAGERPPPTLTAVGGSRVALRKRANSTTTPTGLPGPLPPPLYLPADGPQDFERNAVAEANGHWYLAEKPYYEDFPHADGANFRLWPINPNASYFALVARCEDIYEEERAYSDDLLARGDMKGWFARVYSYVTLNELDAVKARTYQYPHMKLQEVIAFHATYKANLDAWLAGNKGQVETHWREAFSRADYHTGGDWWLPLSMEVLYSLLPAIQAHIRFDLPRAIAAVYVTHYAGIPGTSLEDFRADFEAMASVFEKATEDVRDDITSQAWAIDLGTLGPVQDVSFPFIFSIPTERDLTWEKAGVIAEALQDPKATNADVERQMRAQLTGAHPSSSSGAFEVRGEDIQGTDWLHQQGMMPDAPGPGQEYEPAPAPPAFPEYLYFKFDRPRPDDNLENAIRDDQDLAPYRDLALWTRRVRDADIQIVGSASSEGPDWYNHNLGNERASLLQIFMFKWGADFTNNKIMTWSIGEEYASAGPEDRYAHTTIFSLGTGRQARWRTNINLPSEVNTDAARNMWLYPQ